MAGNQRTNETRRRRRKDGEMEGKSHSNSKNKKKKRSNNNGSESVKDEVEPEVLVIPDSSSDSQSRDEDKNEDEEANQVPDSEEEEEVEEAKSSGIRRQRNNKGVNDDEEEEKHHATKKKKKKKKKTKNLTENKNESDVSNKFPMNRISRIMKSENPDVRITQEAVFLINKASEKFLELFSKEAYACAFLDRRNQVEYKHLSSVVSKRTRFDFLSDFVPEKVKAKDALTEMPSAET